MAKEIKEFSVIFKINIEKFKEFVSKLSDLTKIDEKVMFRLDNDEILLYSLAGNGKDIHAFKSHILSKNDFFSEFKIEGEEKVIKYIFTNAKKSTKKLEHFSSLGEDVKVKIIYNEDGQGEKILFKNAKLNVDIAGGLSNVFKQEINVEQVKKAMDIDISNFNFSLNKEDFTRVRSMGSLDLENNIFQLKIRDKDVYIGENSWKLKIGTTEIENESYSFPKKYFNSINFDGDEDAKIYMFNQFLLVKTSKSNLLITLEITL